MSDRAAELVEVLGMTPHPEGGFFRELFRSTDAVTPADGRGERTALTTIYFLLRDGEHSRLHRVESDEVWHHYEGAPLELVWCADDFATVHRATLGPVGSDSKPVEVVPARYWQAARSTGEYTLVGCTVGPGFDFSDFRLLDPSDPAAERLRAHQPSLVPFL
jgi:uncharacterized protein